MTGRPHDEHDTNDSAVITFEGEEDLDELVPEQARSWADSDRQRSIPKIAKDASVCGQIEAAIPHAPTTHKIFRGDSRQIEGLEPESVQLVVTSPPYWNLKEYDGHNDEQLGDIESYDTFLDELDRVWKRVFKLLSPGGRLVVVVGDVCMSRRKFGRHVVFPLHSSIQERCRKIGFDNLAPIIWHKIANAQFESGKVGGFLGKPYEPNAVIKNDIEYILFQRKSGGYRQPSLAQRILSVIPRETHREYFQQIWSLPGASTKDHPAPYPVALAERLVRMFSFVGDTVLDPFMGTGSTNIAAAKWGRHSIGWEIEPEYFEMARRRLSNAQDSQLSIAI